MDHDLTETILGLGPLGAKDDVTCPSRLSRPTGRTRVAKDSPSETFGSAASAFGR